MLQAREVLRQGMSLICRVEQPLPPVIHAFALLDDARIHELFQNPPEALLGNPQYAEEIGDHDARVALDKMQHTVMRPAEVELGQDIVRITGKILVGKEQELDQIVWQPIFATILHLILRRNIIGLRDGWNCRFEIYVSHIDLILVDCYLSAAANERIGLHDAHFGILWEANPIKVAAVIRIPIVGVLCKKHSSKTDASLWHCSRLLKETNNAQRAGGRWNMAGTPFDQLSGDIWYDGEFVPWSDAKLHILSHGLHYGSSVFEGERAYGGRIFKSEEHTERLLDSAHTLGFEIPWTAEQINRAKEETLERMKLTDAYIRPVAWRGSEMMGISAQNNTIHLAIAAWEWPSYFKPEERLKGIRLDMAEYRRPDPATAPFKAKAAGLYMICTVSKHAAESKGYTDALMLDWRGRIAECTGANVFFIKDGKIHTPTPDCFLDGITRRTVIDLARNRGIEVIERAIMPEELPEFEQCFVTGTAAEVTPVSEIAGNTFEVGEIIKTLMDDYDAAVRPDAPALKAAVG